CESLKAAVTEQYHVRSYVDETWTFAVKESLSYRGGNKECLFTKRCGKTCQAKCRFSSRFLRVLIVLKKGYGPLGRKPAFSPAGRVWLRSVERAQLREQSINVLRGRRLAHPWQERVEHDITLQGAVFQTQRMTHLMRQRREQVHLARLRRIPRGPAM